MSLHQVKVSREEVLSIVRENKEKHDQILKGAVEGYWLDAEVFLKKHEKDQLDIIAKNHKEQLKRLRKSRKDAIKALKANVKTDLERVKAKTRDKGFNFWGGKYPEDHGDDYNGTIRRLELCVEPQVELDTNEFDSYIRNKWQWRDQFLSSNKGYVTSYYNNYGGCSGSYALTASYSLGSTAMWGTGSCLAISASWASSSLAAF